MEVSIREAARIRGVSERRIDQQSKEGGWGIRKVSRGRYFLSDDEVSECMDGTKDKINENELRKRLERTEDFEERAKLICFLAEMELDRLGSKVQPPEFPNENRYFNDREIEWLLNYECYHVGIVSKEDLESMGNSLKKTYEILKKSGDINTLKLEDTYWRIMALASIFSMFGSRDDRNDQRVEIAGNTGLRN